MLHLEPAANLWSRDRPFLLDCSNHRPVPINPHFDTPERQPISNGLLALCCQNNPARPSLRPSELSAATNRIISSKSHQTATFATILVTALGPEDGNNRIRSGPHV